MKKATALILAIFLMAAFTVPASAATRNAQGIITKAHVDTKIYSQSNTSSSVEKKLSKSDSVTVYMNVNDTFKWGKTTSPAKGFVQVKDLAMTKEDYIDTLFGAYVYANIKDGDSGTAVQNVQAALNKTVIAGLTMDGTFGSATKKAVKTFQGGHTGPNGKNLDVDGIVGYNTMWALVTAVNLPPATN